MADEEQVPEELRQPSEPDGVEPDDDAADGWSPTMKELQEALEDSSHPHHAQAVQKNKEIAERLSPALDSLRKTVMSQTSPIAQSMTASANQILAQNRSNMAKIMKGFDHTQWMPKVDPGAFKAPAVPVRPDPTLGVQRQMRESMDALEEVMAERDRAREEEAKATAERLAREDELATQSLAVMTSMDANLRVLADRMDKVDARLVEGNTSADTSSRRMLFVGWATLIATVLGIATTVVLYFLSR